MRFPPHALAVLATAALAVPVVATSAIAATTAISAATPSPSPSSSPSPASTQTQTPAATTPSPSNPQPVVTVTVTVTPKATTAKTPNSTKTTKTTRPKSVPKDAVQVTVKKVVDGDTAEVVTAKGRTVRIGLLEADAPGRGDCWSAEAAARLKALLPPGKPAYVRASEQVPAEGRILIYLWSPTGVYVNGDMVRKGLAESVNSWPEHSYTEWQWLEQSRAQADKLGLWSGCWAADTYDQRDSVKVPSGATPAPVDFADASPAPPGTTYSPEPIPPGSTYTPAPTARPTPTTVPTPTPTPSPTPSPSDTLDPRYPFCTYANLAGYGPYVRGVDPEYDWYEDADGDGVVCER